MSEPKAGKSYIGVGVGAVVLNAERILLLLRRKAPESGYWTIPGGRVEFGETLEQAILREVQEELNARGRVVTSLGVTDHILTNEQTHWVAPRFLVELLDEPVNMEPESHAEMRWFPIGDLPTNVTVTTSRALDAYQSWRLAQVSR